MSVYVDNARHPLGRMKMCHMLADTLHELHDMADKIGVKRVHFQVSKSGTPHYDICLAKRKLAVSFGALEINRMQTVEIMRRLRAAPEVLP